MDQTLEMLALQAGHAERIVEAMQDAIEKAAFRDLVTGESIGSMRANLRTAQTMLIAVKITLKANAAANAERAALKEIGRA